MELVGMLFLLFWFLWFAFLLLLTLVAAAWPRGSREVSGSLKWPRGHPGLKIGSAIFKSNHESHGFRQLKISPIN